MTAESSIQPSKVAYCGEKMFITEHYIETSNNTNKNIYEDLIS